jgi:uncharacterized RDD family membrane protein YckC
MRRGFVLPSPGDEGTRREIVTPEGIPLGLRLADVGERATAFMIDFICILVVTVLLAWLTSLATGGGKASFITAFAIVVSFVLRNFYFVFFELRWQGSTPGKRIVGLRVIDGRGGPLDAHAVFARNLVRDIEVFLPLQVLLVPEQLWPNAPGWARLLSMLWLLVFMLMPLLNKDRLRIGDMVGGTIVVLQPKSVLLPDIGAEGPTAGSARAPTYVFTSQQLDAYGIYELQVLENVLRGQDRLDNRAALETVCERIKVKIDWERSRWHVDPNVFLRDFYAALRARLERKMMFGKKRKDKYSPDESIH